MNPAERHLLLTVARALIGVIALLEYRVLEAHEVQLIEERTQELIPAIEACGGLPT